MLELTNISKGYSGQPVLQHLDLSFAGGETTVLIGPSGCGKSTILKLIAGLITADAGTVMVNDEVIKKENMDDFRHRLGYVIQDGGLFPHLKARDNVVLMARFLKWPEEKIHHRLDELTTMFHMTGEMLDRFPLELSGGQRQRISLMRALMLDPDLLLMDEPLSALDPMIRFDLQQELKSIFHQLRKTVVLVTHDMAEAGYFGDEIVLLDNGKVIQRGTLQDMLNSPEHLFVSEFISAQRSHWSLFDRGGGNE